MSTPSLVRCHKHTRSHADTFWPCLRPTTFATDSLTRKMSRIYTAETSREAYCQATMTVLSLDNLMPSDEIQAPEIDEKRNQKRKLSRGEREDEAYRRKSTVRRCSRCRQAGHTCTTCPT